ncbi:hypothetical protein D6T65_02690 [Arthrobacter frigidicola]|nr:hypothetical protein D6T65_02690 [Arthrobacter frigidicola]
MPWCWARSAPPASKETRSGRGPGSASGTRPLCVNRRFGPGSPPGPGPPAAPGALRTFGPAATARPGGSWGARQRPESRTCRESDAG